jgi:hypothetical protein
MNYKVFCLTMAQAAQYERHGREPNTTICPTVSVDKANSLVGPHEGYGTARWVGGNFRFIVDIPTKSWGKKLSGGIAVMQMR